LVVWDIFYFPRYWESSSQLLTFIFFQRGRCTTNHIYICGYTVLDYPC
jgi:hypothetical protein